MTVTSNMALVFQMTKKKPFNFFLPFMTSLFFKFAFSKAWREKKNLAAWDGIHHKCKLRREGFQSSIGIAEELLILCYVEFSLKHLLWCPKAWNIQSYIFDNTKNQSIQVTLAPHLTTIPCTYIIWWNFLVTCFIMSLL